MGPVNLSDAQMSNVFPAVNVFGYETGNCIVHDLLKKRSLRSDYVTRPMLYHL